MVEIGSPAPAFELESDTGETITLGSFAGKRAVLFFYPRDNTSG
jgi:peroxiredoxin Q/BCP